MRVMIGVPDASPTLAVLLAVEGPPHLIKRRYSDSLLADWLDPFDATSTS
jgi:hypothetical protein